MIADAKEIAGLTCEAELGTEGNDTLHTAHLSLPDILIAAPVAFTIPSDMVGCLDIMHDGGNAGLLIFHVGIVIQGFVAYLFDLLIFILCSLQLLFKGINLTL